jgi:multiple sugar transport system substrate-binding protein
MKKSMRRMLFIVTVFTLIVALAVGCSDSGKSSNGGNTGKTNEGASKVDSKDKMELRFIWWGSQSRHDRTLKVIEMFEELHPNVTINPEFTGGAEIYQRLATQAAGNNLPDIVQMDLPILAEYVNRGQLLSLEDYTASGDINIEDIDPSFIEGGKIDGKLYALSIGTTGIAMAVDPAMYEKAGLEIPKPGYTWDDYIKQAYQLKEKLGKDVYVRSMSGFSEFKQIYLEEQGQHLYNADATGLGYEDKYLIEFFEMWKKLLDDGVIPRPDLTATIQGLEDELIVHGKAPNLAAQQPRIAFNSNQFIALSKAANRPLKLTMYPIFADGQKGQHIKPSQFLSISSESKHPDIAAQFIDFFTNSKEANEVLGAERGVPVSSKVRAHLYETMDQAGKETFDYIEAVSKYSAGIPASPAGDSTLLDIFDKTYEKMAFGQLTPTKAAQQFRADAEDVLKKNKK